MVLGVPILKHLIHNIFFLVHAMYVVNINLFHFESEPQFILLSIVFFSFSSFILLMYFSC